MRALVTESSSTVSTLSDRELELYLPEDQALVSDQAIVKEMISRFGQARSEQSEDLRSVVTGGQLVSVVSNGTQVGLNYEYCIADHDEDNGEYGIPKKELLALFEKAKLIDITEAVKDCPEAEYMLSLDLDSGYDALCVSFNVYFDYAEGAFVYPHVDASTVIERAEAAIMKIVDLI